MKLSVVLFNQVFHFVFFVATFLCQGKGSSHEKHEIKGSLIPQYI